MNCHHSQWHEGRRFHADEPDAPQAPRYYYLVTALYNNSLERPPSAQVSFVPSAPISLADVAWATPLQGTAGAGGTRFSISIPQSGVGMFYHTVTSKTLADSAWPNARSAFQGNGGLL